MVLAGNTEETYLVFVQAEERFLDIPYHRCRVGLNHLAFHAKSKEHVDEITDRFKGERDYKSYTKTSTPMLVEKIITLFFLKIQIVSK